MLDAKVLPTMLDLMYRNGFATALDPGAGGTIAVWSKGNAICEVATAKAELRYLESAVSYGVGQELCVMLATAGGALTIIGPADDSVTLVTAGDLAVFKVSVYGSSKVWKVISKPQSALVSNLPAITPASFPASPTSVVNFRRDATMYAREEEFCFYRHDFATSTNTNQTVFSNNGVGTKTEGSGHCTYVSGSAATDTLLGKKRFQTAASLVAKLRIHSLNAPAAAYNDIGVGFALTTTTTSDIVDNKLVAYYRVTAAKPLGQILLFFNYGPGGATGNAFEAYDLPAALTAPFDLLCIINQGGFAAGVDEGGKERILVTKSTVEIEQALIDLEDATTVAKLRPLIHWQSAGAISAVTSLWEVRTTGSLGDREHYPATNEDGSALRDDRGFIYMSADACHVSTRSYDSASAYSEYMKSPGATGLYNPTTGRWIQRNTGRYAIKRGTKIFAAMQVKIMFDRRTGKYHFFCSAWNLGAPTVFMLHVATYENILHGYWVFDETQYEVIDLTSLGAPFSTTNAYWYDTDIQEYHGRWLLSGTVSVSGSVRPAFCVSGASPDNAGFQATNGGRIEFVSTTIDEGTRLWRVAGVPYVATALQSGVTKVMNLVGTTVASITLPGVAGGYPAQASLLAIPLVNKTWYQVVHFSDSTRPAAPNETKGGDDFKADIPGEVMPLTFGALVVTDLGTFTGEEYPGRRGTR